MRDLFSVAPCLPGRPLDRRMLGIRVLRSSIATKTTLLSFARHVLLTWIPCRDSSQQEGMRAMAKSTRKRVAIYLRVSTTEQTTDNQRRELKAVAARHAWSVVSFFEDAGISGAKGREERPGLDALMKAVARREIDMVAAWSVDRLGWSLIDFLDFLRELHANDVDLFLHQ